MSSAIQLPRTNLVIGGDFDTNPWQRGTSFAGLTGGALGTYTADRFSLYITAAATAVLTISKTADAPTATQTGFLTSNCLKVLATTGAAPAANDIVCMRYRMEGYDFTQIAQSSFTISFWVKTTVTGIHCIALQNSGNDRSYIAEYTVNSANTWEYKTVTIAASPSAGTWNYTNGIGLDIFWALSVGATYTNGTNGSWTATTSFADANQVNVLASNNNIFELALIQVRAGTQAQPWAVRTFQQELALCQRYYCKTFNQGTTPAQAIGSGLGEISGAVSSPGTTTVTLHAQFPVTMRTAPTIVTYNPGAANAQMLTSGVGDCSAIGLVPEGMRGIWITATGNVAAVVTNVNLINFTASAEL